MQTPTVQTEAIQALQKAVQALRLSDDAFLSCRYICASSVGPAVFDLLETAQRAAEQALDLLERA
jgi:hypothetical protein